MITPHLAGMSWRLTHQSEPQRREADEALGRLASHTRRLRRTLSLWQPRTRWVPGTRPAPAQPDTGASKWEEMNVNSCPRR